MLNATRYRSFRTCLIALFVVAMPPAMSSASQVFDASADFDPAHNPSTINGGTYSYGFSDTLDGSFSLLLGTYTNGPVAGYNRPGFPDGAPSILKNTSESPYTLGGGIHYEPHQLVMHPGSDGQYALLRFTAPLAGNYSYEADFSGADDTGVGTTTDVHILVNGIDVAAASLNINGGGNTASFSSSIVLAAGDTIDFAVGRGNSSFFFDSTGLFANVAMVPEPSTMILLAAGAAILATARLRRRRS